MNILKRLYIWPMTPKEKLQNEITNRLISQLQDNDPNIDIFGRTIADRSASVDYELDDNRKNIHDHRRDRIIKFYISSPKRTELFDQYFAKKALKAINKYRSKKPEYNELAAYEEWIKYQGLSELNKLLPETKDPRKKARMFKELMIKYPDLKEKMNATLDLYSEYYTFEVLGSDNDKSKDS